jgi:hypothetical protein
MAVEFKPMTFSELPPMSEEDYSKRHGLLNVLRRSKSPSNIESAKRQLLALESKLLGKPVVDFV